MVDAISTVGRSVGEAVFAITPAWHGLGTVLDHAPSSSEALDKAGLDWRVEKKHIYWKPDGSDWKTVPDHKVTVRSNKDGTDLVLGVVGKDYSIVQNRDAFGFMDEVLGDNGVTYEAAGALYDGRKVWMLARLPEDIEVGPDSIRRYLLFSNSHDGSQAVRCFFTPVRVVCANTLMWAMKNAKGGICIRHTGRIESKIGEAQRILGLASAAYESVGEQFNRLLETPLNVGQASDYFKGLVGDPQSFKEGAARTRRTNILNDLRILNHSGRGIAAVKGTVWAAYNAVAEYTDHQRSTRGKDEKRRQENRLASQWFGSGADLKVKAFRSACILAGVKDATDTPVTLS